MPVHRHHAGPHPSRRLYRSSSHLMPFPRPDRQEIDVAGSAPGGKRQEQWDVRSQLGKGSAGVVYKGVWRGLDVAIKRVMFQVLFPGGVG